MQIANPIYDVFFKDMISNQKTAKFFIETLIEQKVINLTPLPTEKVSYLRELQIMRYDYSCTIELKDGTQKTLIVELQKNKNEIDIGRFRQYLGKHYSEEYLQTVDKQGQSVEKVQYLPIIAIYFLGFNLKHPQPFIKAENKLIDLDKQIIIEQSKDEFIEKLTHHSYFIQIKRILEANQDRLSKAFQMFNQNYKVTTLPEKLSYQDYKDAILEIPENIITPETKEIFEDLQNMLKQPQVMESYKESRRLEILRKETEVTFFQEGEEKGKIEGLEEGEKKGKIQGKIEVARKMKRRNTPIEYIMEDTGLSFEEIERI